MPGLVTKHYAGHSGYDYIPTLLATMIVDGEDVEYETNAGNKKGKITSYNFKGTQYTIKSTDNPQTHVKRWQGMTKAADLSFNYGDTTISSTKIHKTSDFGGGGGGSKGFNMGNVSEGLFAAAIFAKFTVGRTKQVTSVEVIDVLEKLAGATASKVPGKKSVQGQMQAEAPNKKIPEPDIIHYQFGLSANNHKALINSNNWKGASFLGIIRYACAYANSRQVSQWVDLIYANGRVDNIVVHADGEANQKGTKVDVKVFCSDNTPDPKLKKLDINVSLKVNGIRQFGQVGGTEYDNQLKFWTQLFPDMKLQNPITEREYLKKAVPLNAEATDYGNAIMAYYKAMHKQLKNLERLENDKLAKAFADGVTFYGSLNEPNVELLDIHEVKGATSVDLDKIRFLLANRGIKIAELKESNPQAGNTKLPTIIYQVMIDGKWEDFLQTRAKKSGSNKTGPYYRNIIEKLNGFSKLLGVKVPEDGSFEFGRTSNKYY